MFTDGCADGEPDHGTNGHNGPDHYARGHPHPHRYDRTEREPGSNARANRHGVPAGGGAAG
jgi:hypothetical protein